MKASEFSVFYYFDIVPHKTEKDNQKIFYDIAEMFN